MNWDQIEIKWAEMTSRVRADVPVALPRAKPGAVADTLGARIGQVPEKGHDTTGPAINR